MLPIDTRLGELDIFEIYEYMDGPRLFAARDVIGTSFLVYWIDESDESSGWLYLPISGKRLKQLRRKKRSLRWAYMNPEMSHYYVVYTRFDDEPDVVDFVPKQEIDLEFLPPKDFYIEYVEVINKKVDAWSFETILKTKQANGTPNARVLSDFIDVFRELIEPLMQNASGSHHFKPQLYPIGADPGSIEVQFATNDDELVLESLVLVAELVDILNVNDLQARILTGQVNPYRLKDFLTCISSNRLTVDIIPKLAVNGGKISLSDDNVAHCLSLLENVEATIIDSKHVPQANDLDKVLEIILLIDKGIPLTPDTIDGLTSNRQVDYYKHAARTLSLTNRSYRLTPAGRYVNAQADKESKYQILADRFESTEFGWAWMKWARVKSMVELDPTTATAFLNHSARGLADGTKRRRSTALSSWLTKLQPHHRKSDIVNTQNN
ncbi:MAG: DUF6575 domain-containing protein [Candidatus Promineifilaceae bacterium]